MAIHIKEKNKGKFTRKAKAHGKGVQEFARQVLANKDNYSTATVKQANFARNFGGRKQTGGYSDEEILGYSDDSPYQDNPYIHINSNNISMAQTGIPLSLIPLDEDFNMLGQYDVNPYSGEYIFDGANSVLEIPNAQIGSRSPRHMETPEERRIRMASYQRPGVNYGNAFINDIDNTMSREVNVPFVQNPSVMSNNTSKGVITNNSGKSPVTSKIKNKTVASSNVKKPVTFWNEPTKAELEQQAIDYAPTIDKVDTIIPNDVFSNSTSVIEDSLTGMKKIIPGKPITLEYDNPLEAQAINYRKLKNSEVMPPYRGSMQLQTPSLYQESVDPYLANIKEQRNAVMQNINPNTSVGQAMLAGINANLIDASNKAIGEVSRNNMQNTTNWLNQVADIRNKQQSFDYENNRRYADEVAQLKAIQDEGDIAYMDSVANMNAKRLQAKNRFLTTAIETGLPSEALNIGDESVTFDVNKIPYQIYTRDSGANTPVNQKPIKMGDKYYDKVVENGRVRYVSVNIDNKQLGGNAQIYPEQDKSVWDNIKSNVLNYPSIKAIRDLRTNSPVVYNAASILDPTGVSGWEDVQDSWNDGEFTYEDILNPIGALPMIGKVPSGLKLAKKVLTAEKIDKAFKPLHRVANTIDKITPFAKEVETVTGKLANKAITSPIYTPFKAGYNTMVDLLNTANFGVDVAQTAKSVIKKKKK